MDGGLLMSAHARLSSAQALLLLSGAIVASARSSETYRMIEPTIHSDSESDRAWWALMALLSQRIHDGLAGKVSLKSINDILEEEVV